MTFKCPKCGNTNINITFHPRGEKTTRWTLESKPYLRDLAKPINQSVTNYVIDKEILECHCRRCQYGWYEEPLDKREKEKSNSDCIDSPVDWFTPY